MAYPLDLRSESYCEYHRLELKRDLELDEHPLDKDCQ